MNTKKKAVKPLTIRCLALLIAMLMLLGSFPVAAMAMPVQDDAQADIGVEPLGIEPLGAGGNLTWNAPSLNEPVGTTTVDVVVPFTNATPRATFVALGFEWESPLEFVGVTAGSEPSDDVRPAANRAFLQWDPNAANAMGATGSITLTFNIPAGHPAGDVGDFWMIHVPTTINSNGPVTNIGTMRGTISLYELPPVIAKTSEYTAPLRVGDDVTYTLTLTNPNAVALNNRLIVDNLANGALAADLATVTVTPTTALVGTPAIVDGRLELVVNIPANGAVVTFDAEVLQTGTVTNLGSVYGPPVYVPGDNGEPGDYERPNVPEDTDEEPVNVEQLLPPVIAKTSSYTVPLRVGDDVTYTLTLTNPNAVALNNRLVVDNLANGALAAELATVTVTPATALVGTPAIVDGRLELVVNIPANGAVVTFEAEVLQTGTVTNLGSVYGPPVYVPGDNGEPGDYERPNVPEDTDEEPVNVEQLLPPVIAKTSSYTAPLRVGDDVTYTLTLTNPNAVALNNRLIVDNLANGALAADLATVTVTPTTALVGTPAIVDGRLELVVNIPANGAVVTFDAEVLQTGTVTNLGSVYGPPVYVPGDNGEPGDYERPNVPEDTDEEPVDVEQLLPPVIAKTSEYTAPLRVGDDVTYTLTLTNPNAVALNNRLIVDNLANGALAADLATVVVTPATALVGTPAIVDGRLELVVNIPANGVTVTFEAEVLQPGTVTNLGSVYGPPVYVPGDNGEPGDYERPDEPEDTDEEPVDVEQLLPPVIAKTSSYTAPLRVGDDVTYTLTLTNPNAVALNNRLIVDNLANGALAADLATVVVTPATALVGAPAIVDGRLELVVNIPATGVTVTFEAEVLQPGTVTNLGSVYGPPVYVPGDNGEPGDYERPNVPEDTDEEPVDVEQLLPPVMAKTSEYTAPLRVGDDVTYTLTLTNPNAVALNNRLIVDNLANGALVADLATVVVTPATALVGTPQLVDGRLELVVNIPATGVTVTFEAEVLQPGTVTNLGSVYGPPVYVPGDNGEPGDYERPDEPEDTDEEPVDVEQLLPPVMAKTSSYTAPLRVGDDVTYTLTLTNPNAVALNNRLIVDNLANGALVADLATVVVTPATALVGTPQLVDGRLELVVNIPANGVTVTFEAEVLQPGTVTNLGSVYGPPVYVPGDNGEPGDYERPDEPEDTDEEPVDVEQPSTFEPEPGVEIVKSTNVPADTAVRVGDTVTYTIRVTNTGNVALTDLVVLDPLPIHLTNPRVLALPAEAVGGFAENTLRVELASLAPGAYVEITFVAMVAAGTPAGPLVNEATVRSEMHDRDDTDTATVTVENPFSPYHNSFIIGRPTGNIYPRDNITRSEVAAVFFRLLSDDFRIEMWSQENPFPDVTGDRWFNNEVSTITNAGVIHGLPDGTFGPARAITRAEVTAIVARFFNEQEDIEEEVFTDITGHWAEGYINSLAHFGWIEGPGDGTFRPNQLLTRAEFAAIINRMLNRLPEDIGALLDGRTRWPDKTNPNAWYYLYLQEASHSTEFERLENGYLTWTAILPHIDWSLLSRPDSRPDDIMVARNR